MMKFFKMGTVLAVSVLIGITASAAPSSPLTISADQLSYDGKTKVATAEGNVVIEDADKTMLGSSGWYNTETRDAFLTGGITVAGPDIAARAAEINTYNDDRMVARGSVFLKKADREIYGDTVDYTQSTGYGTVTGNAKLVVAEAIMTADYIESWLNEIRAIGTGNVKLHSEQRNLDASGDRIDYHQTPGKEDGVAYLSGNAYAVQNGNTLKGDAFTITMSDNAIQTEGRSTLVITPK